MDEDHVENAHNDADAFKGMDRMGKRPNYYAVASSKCGRKRDRSKSDDWLRSTNGAAAMPHRPVLVMSLSSLNKSWHASGNTSSERSGSSTKEGISIRLPFMPFVSIKGRFFRTKKRSDSLNSSSLSDVSFRPQLIEEYI